MLTVKEQTACERKKLFIRLYSMHHKYKWYISILRIGLLQASLFFFLQLSFLDLAVCTGSYLQLFRTSVEQVLNLNGRSRRVLMERKAELKHATDDRSQPMSFPFNCHNKASTNKASTLLQTLCIKENGCLDTVYHSPINMDPRTVYVINLVYIRTSSSSLWV